MTTLLYFHTLSVYVYWPNEITTTMINALYKRATDKQIVQVLTTK